MYKLRFHPDCQLHWLGMYSMQATQTAQVVPHACREPFVGSEAVVEPGSIVHLRAFVFINELKFAWSLKRSYRKDGGKHSITVPNSLVF